MANYYSGDTLPFGLFTRHGVRKKSYFAMKAFASLLETERRVSVKGGRPGEVAAAAGVDGQRREMTALISNLKSNDSSFTLAVDPLPWKGATAWNIFLLDAEHDLDLERTGSAGEGRVKILFALKAPALALIQFIRKEE